MMDQEISGAAVQNEPAQKALEKRGKRRKKRKVLDGFTQLYRCYNKDGILLYVGITFCGIARLISHRTTSCWYKKITTIKIDNFSTRLDASIAEYLAIRDENPKHNGPSWQHQRYYPAQIEAYYAKYGS